jgi:uncharacterized protein YbjT (DUF2867 family)
MTVAIAGATGLTGSHCLEQLLRNNRIEKVIAIGRRPSGVADPRLQEVILQNGKLPSPIITDAFICCLGTTLSKAGSRAAFRAVDFDLPLYLAEQLLAGGCGKMAFISAMSANAKSVFLYNRVKGELETALKKLGFAALHILRPSFIGGNRKEYRPVEKIALPIFHLFGPLLKGSWQHYRVIEAKTLAAGLIAAILRPEKGQFIYLSEEIKNLVSA